MAGLAGAVHEMAAECLAEPGVPGEHGVHAGGLEGGGRTPVRGVEIGLLDLVPDRIAGEPDQVVLGFDVPVDGRGGRAEPFGQAAHVEAVQPLVVQQLDGCLDDPLCGQRVSRHGHHLS